MTNDDLIDIFNFIIKTDEGKVAARKINKYVLKKY